MAKVGLEYIVAGELDTSVSVSTATVKYKNSREIGPGAAFNGSPTVSDVKDYGDDRVVETDTSFTGGTLNTELNEPTLENEAWLLGHAFSKNDNSMISNADDLAPFVGVGAIGKSKRNGKLVYKMKVYLKVQYKEHNDENATKQENVNFGHTPLEGNMYQLENGDWKKEAEFSTLEAAKTALNAMFGITSTGASA